MSLSIKEKDNIRSVKVGWFYVIDENGEAKYPCKLVETPNYEVGELREQIIKIFDKMGYTVRFVNPRYANCIIRVFKSEKEYEDEKYRILGACCYTKVRNGKWITGNEYPIDFSTYPVRIWFYQDEYWDVSVDFFDTYVEIVKKK